MVSALLSSSTPCSGPRRQVAVRRARGGRGRRAARGRCSRGCAGIGRTSGATENDSPTACPGVGYGSCPTISTRTSSKGCWKARSTFAPGRQVAAAAGDLGAQEVAHRCATTGSTGANARAHPASTISDNGFPATRGPSSRSGAASWPDRSQSGAGRPPRAEREGQRRGRIDHSPRVTGRGAPGEPRRCSPTVRARHGRSPGACPATDPPGRAQGRPSGHIPHAVPGPAPVSPGPRERAAHGAPSRSAGSRSAGPRSAGPRSAGRCSASSSTTSEASGYSPAAVGRAPDDLRHHRRRDHLEQHDEHQGHGAGQLHPQRRAQQYQGQAQRLRLRRSLQPGRQVRQPHEADRAQQARRRPEPASARP